MKNTKIILLTLGSVLFLAACAPKRPVLYPNDHLNQVGQAAAQRDIDACMALAVEYAGERDVAGEIAKDTAEGAVIGGVAGAAVGAVYDDVGKGAAAGAAGGGAAAMTRGIFRASEHDPVFRSFVDRCLREKGYVPIGWR